MDDNINKNNIAIAPTYIRTYNIPINTKPWLYKHIAVLTNKIIKHSILCTGVNIPIASKLLIPLIRFIFNFLFFIILNWEI